MSLARRKRVLLSAIEDNEGVFKNPVVASAGVITSEAHELEHAVEQIPDESSQTTFTRVKSTPGAGSATATITQRIAGSGTHNVEPRWARHLKTCGFYEDSRAVKIPLTGLPSGAKFTPGAIVAAGQNVVSVNTADPVEVTIAADHAKGTGAGTVRIEGMFGTGAPADGDYACTYLTTTTLTLTDVNGTSSAGWTVDMARCITARGIGLAFVSLGTTTGSLYALPNPADTFEDSQKIYEIPNIANDADGGTVTAHGKVYRPDSERQIDVTLNAAVSHYRGGPSTTAIVPPLEGTVLLFVAPGSASINGAAIVISINSAVYTMRFLYGSINVDDEVMAAAVMGTADPEQGKLLDGAGIGDVVDVDTVVQTRGFSLSLRDNLDGLERHAAGQRGEFSAQVDAGQAGNFTFAYQGQKSGDEDDVTQPTGVGYGTQATPPRFENGFVLPDGRPVRVNSLSFAMGNQITSPQDGNSPDGLTAAIIGGREPAFSIQLQTPGAGGLPLAAKQVSAASMVMGFQLGTVEGNIVSCVASDGQVTEITHADQDGVDVVTAKIDATKGSSTHLAYDGDDEVYVFHG